MDGDDDDDAPGLWVTPVADDDNGGNVMVEVLFSG